MSKLTNLLTLSDYLKASQRYYLRCFLHNQFPEPATETKPRYEHQLLLLTLLLAQVDDHVRSVNLLELTCEHGMAGTAPAGLEDFTYDPYAHLKWALARPDVADNKDAPISCLVLSDELLHYIDELPDQEFGLAQANVLRHFSDYARWAEVDDTMAKAAEQASTAALEATLWVQSYAPDMAELHRLVDQRAPFSEIQAYLT